MLSVLRMSRESKAHIALDDKQCSKGDIMYQLEALHEADRCLSLCLLYFHVRSDLPRAFSVGG